MYCYYKAGKEKHSKKSLIEQLDSLICLLLCTIFDNCSNEIGYCYEKRLFRQTTVTTIVD